MNILMMTNTYVPHVGGVARSVLAFSQMLRKMGHRVLVVAPTFEGSPPDEIDVIRLPAIQHFNGSDFSVRLPIPGLLSTALDAFQPDIVHSHHPFLVGDAALGVATLRDLPLVFTHHTMYEQYTHYVPGDSPAMKRFAVRMATEYANLCDHVIAPSESIAQILKRCGVSVPTTVIPTGVDSKRFSRGNGSSARTRYNIPSDAFIVGHVGRLAPEKNLSFLARAVAAFLQCNANAHFFVAGVGPSEPEIMGLFAERGLSKRLHIVGVLPDVQLANAYHAMDVFAFASRSETQGLVLVEAMVAGVPVVAIDASGVREVVVNNENGWLLPHQDETAFSEALLTIATLGATERAVLSRTCRETARAFSLKYSTQRLLSLYEKTIETSPREQPREHSKWRQTLRFLEMEWKLWSGRADAAVQSRQPGASSGH